MTLHGTLVVGAAVFRDGRLLVARRNRPAELAGLWELPGGKVEPGESLADAAARELDEELGLSITVGAQVPGDFELGNRMFMRVVLAVPAPEATHDVTLGDTHDAVRWVTRDEALLMYRHDSVDWVPADIPAVAAVANALGAAWH